MKKILKEILKWVTCVFLTFTVVFTLAQYESICKGIDFRTGLLGNVITMEEYFNNEEEIIKWYDESTNEMFLGKEDDVTRKVYLQYPAGVTRIMCDMANSITYANITFLSLNLGIVIGTGIYMLLDKDKKGLKIVITIYFLSIIVLGFVQGFINVSGEKLTLLDRWMFPDEYIIPVTIAFALVVVVRVLRQKEMAKKLNEKLRQRKGEKTK